MTFSAMTVYYSEISLPATRGLVSSMHGLAIEAAAAASAWIGLGCLYANRGSFGWRFTAALVPAAGICFMIATFFGTSLNIPFDYRIKHQLELT
jgi:hypothetical protein